MSKYWVTFSKSAGVEIDAESEDEAIEKAKEVPESEYEFDQFNPNEWVCDENAELVDDEEEDEE